MNNKLYVGNISFQADENTLEQAFGEFGTVKSVKIITDRDTGRSKGFGFVEMETEDEAADCVSKLDGQDIAGRPVRVNIAKPREDNRGGGSRGGAGGGNRGGGGGRW